MKKRLIIEIIAILFVVLFLYTAISKISDYTIFKENLQTSEIIGPLAFLIAPLLLFIEALIPIFLLVPRWRLKGLYFSTVIMSLFTTYLILNNLSTESFPCSCGGIIGNLSVPQHIAVNCTYILLGIIAIRMENQVRKSSLEVSDRRASNPM